MDCEQVRDQFSSLWEKELVSSEEKIIREHLSSCPRCQEEFERFGKTMELLSSVGDVEVPEGFLPELYKKIEKRKAALPAEKSGGRWYVFPLSFKLPAQAIAMAGIVFLVLYLAKMGPMEVSHQKEADQISSILSGAKKEVKKEEASAPESEVMASRQIESKEAARERIPTPGPDKFKGGLVSKEKHALPSKPSQEFTLRIADREKAISQLQGLVKYLRGEMMAEGEDRFLVSLPAASFPEFEKELERMSVSTKTDKEMAKNRISRSSGAVSDFKQEEGSERIKESAKVDSDQESRTVVLILLTPE